MDTVPAVFRSAFDDDAAIDAVDLRGMGIQLYYPFFANTFPLAFHCAQAMNETKGGRGANCRIMLAPWGDDQKILDGQDEAGPPVVFYTTLRRISELRAQPNTILRKVDLWRYKPRWIFAEFSLALLREVRKLFHTETGIPGPAEFTAIVPALARLFERVEVFTEVPELASSILETLSPQLVERCDFLSPEKSMLFDEKHLVGCVARLFIYGAPISSYLKRKGGRYIAFRVGDAPFLKDNEDLLTVIAVQAQQESDVDKVCKLLGSYHSKLDRWARQEAREEKDSFRALQYHYNRLARLLQHRSSFGSSWEYARCLTEHQEAAAKPASVGGR